MKMIALLDEYPKCFLVGADNVSSKQMQQIRMSMRGVGVVLMGKNTMMRKAIRGHMNNNPDLERLLPHIKGNIGFVFTDGDLIEVRDKLLENKVAAPARVPKRPLSSKRWLSQPRFQGVPSKSSTTSSC